MQRFNLKKALKWNGCKCLKFTVILSYETITTQNTCLCKKSIWKNFFLQVNKSLYKKLEFFKPLSDTKCNKILGLFESPIFVDKAFRDKLLMIWKQLNEQKKMFYFKHEKVSANLIPFHPQKLPTARRPQQFPS